jgi:hypothetical protein
MDKRRSVWRDGTTGARLSSSKDQRPNLSVKSIVVFLLHKPEQDADSMPRPRSCIRTRQDDACLVEKGRTVTASPLLRSPDWDALIALLDDACQSKGLLKPGASRVISNSAGCVA